MLYTFGDTAVDQIRKATRREETRPRVLGDPLQKNPTRSGKEIRLVRTTTDASLCPTYPATGDTFLVEFGEGEFDDDACGYKTLTFDEYTSERELRFARTVDGSYLANGTTATAFLQHGRWILIPADAPLIGRVTTAIPYRPTGTNLPDGSPGGGNVQLYTIDSSGDLQATGVYITCRNPSAQMLPVGQLVNVDRRAGAYVCYPVAPNNAVHGVSVYATSSAMPSIGSNVSFLWDGGMSSWQRDSTMAAYADIPGNGVRLNRKGSYAVRWKVILLGPSDHSDHECGGVDVINFKLSYTGGAGAFSSHRELCPATFVYPGVGISAVTVDAHTHDINNEPDHNHGGTVGNDGVHAHGGQTTGASAATTTLSYSNRGYGGQQKVISGFCDLIPLSTGILTMQPASFTTTTTSNGGHTAHALSDYSIIGAFIGVTAIGRGDLAGTATDAFS